MKYLFTLAALACAPAHAKLIDADDVGGLPLADVIFLGEVHDNPMHHDNQARAIEQIGPTALVLEMLDPDQASRMPDSLPDMAELRALLDWDASGWPDFALYYPLFSAAPQAQVFGAGLPREAARAAMGQDLDQVLSGDAALFGLTTDLPTAQQHEREALQARAHCRRICCPEWSISSACAMPCWPMPHWRP